MGTSEKVSAIDKLMSVGMKLKDQATDYIKEHPDQVESMKEQAIGTLKQTVDKEVEKEEAKMNQHDDADGTKPSTFDKYKAEAINALKPQLDKMADASKNENEEATTTSSSPPPEEDASATPSVEDRSSVTNIAPGTSAAKINNVQELVTALLNTMDDASNLSADDQKKAMNAFNAAFALKNI